MVPSRNSLDVGAGQPQPLDAELPLRQSAAQLPLLELHQPAARHARDGVLRDAREDRQVVHRPLADGGDELAGQVVERPHVGPGEGELPVHRSRTEPATLAEPPQECAEAQADELQPALDLDGRPPGDGRLAVDPATEQLPAGVADAEPAAAAGGVRPVERDPHLGELKPGHLAALKRDRPAAAGLRAETAAGGNGDSGTEGVEPERAEQPPRVGAVEGERVEAPLRVDEVVPQPAAKRAVGEPAGHLRYLHRGRRDADHGPHVLTEPRLAPAEVDDLQPAVPHQTARPPSYGRSSAFRFTVPRSGPSWGTPRASAKSAELQPAQPDSAAHRLAVGLRRLLLLVERVRPASGRSLPPSVSPVRS